MFQRCINFIKVNEDLFEVKRTYSEERVKDVMLLKEWLGVDAVFKKEGSLYFCNKIIELEVVN
jgi:hypothetical protein